jgi:hypothetical protein
MATFPQAVLDLKCDLDLAGTWTDVTSYVYQRDNPTPVTVERGRKDEGTTAELSQATFELNNRSGRFTPLNPSGAYYGQLSRNTPVRFSVPAVSNYLRLEADTASYAAAPDTAGLSVTGDTEIQLDLQPSTYVAEVLASKWAASSQQSWMLQLLADGTLTFSWSSSGSNTLSVNSGLPLPLGRGAVKVTLAVATGTVTFYTAATIAGSWTQLGTAASGTAGASTSVFDSTADVELGNYLSGAGTVPGMCGRIFAFKLLSGIGGTVEASPDFTAQTAGATSFTDAQSNTWIVHGTGEISGRDYRFHGEMAALPSTWDATGTDVWTPVAAAGLLRRLGQGNAPLYSAVRRAILDLSGSSAPVAYWPCEDGQGSTSIGPAIGGITMTVYGTATFASDSSFACSASLPVIGLSTWYAAVPAYTSSGSLAARFLLDAASAPNAEVLRVATTGTAAALTVNFSSGQLAAKGLNAAGGAVFTSAAAAQTITATPVWVSLELAPSGGNVDYTLAVLAAGSASPVTVTGSYAGSVGNATSVTVNQPAAALSGVAVGHITIASAYSSLSAYYQPLQAWAGETAAARVARLCAENSITPRIYGAPSASAAMGTQTVQDLMTLLRECEDADLGMIYEPRQVLGLGYRTQAALCNQAAAVTLDYSAAELGGDGSALQPTYDDQYTRNDITAQRSSGTTSTAGVTYRATLNDGTAMSISPPPTGVGEYSSSVTANTAADSQLPDVAWWRVHLGTVNQQRWPHIPVNMARSAVSGVKNALQGCDVGDYLQVTNPPSWLAPDTIRQVIAGTSEVLGGFHWTIAFHCVPESPYETGIYDNATYGRADTDGSTLASSATSGATSLSVATTSAATPLWTTAAADFPFDIAIDGERITVTNITGGSSPQTFTVTRSVNGVVKAHSSGVDVRLWFPPVYAAA